MASQEHFPANLPGWLENNWPLKNNSPQISPCWRLDVYKAVAFPLCLQLVERVDLHS